MRRQNLAAVALQQELKKLSDSDLMELDIAAWDLMAEDQRVDSTLTMALYMEVERRTFSAGWAWNRLRKRDVWESWQRHKAETEVRALRMAENVTRRFETE